MIYLDRAKHIFKQWGLDESSINKMTKTINANYTRSFLLKVVKALNTSYIMLYGKDYKKSCIIMPNEIKYKNLLAKVSTKEQANIYHNVSDKLKQDLAANDNKVSQLAKQYNTSATTINSLMSKSAIGYITHSARRDTIYFIKINELKFGYNFEDARLTDKKVKLIKKTYDEKDLITINNTIGGVVLAFNPTDTKVALISYDYNNDLTDNITKKYLCFKNRAEFLRYKLADVDYSLKKLAKQQKTTAEELIKAITDENTIYDCLDAVFGNDTVYSDYNFSEHEADDFIEGMAEAMLPGEIFIELKDLFKEED